MFFKRKKKSAQDPQQDSAEQRAETEAPAAGEVAPAGETAPKQRIGATGSDGVNADGTGTADAADADGTGTGTTGTVTNGTGTAGERPADAKPGFFARIKRGLARTSQSFTEGLGNLVLGKKEIDEELLEDIEAQLLMADIGMEATSEIVDDLTAQVARRQLADGDALYEALQRSLQAMLEPVEQPLRVEAEKQPFVILVVGVNGVGKTTTIGKLAKRLQQQGKSVMLAAGDTFRAAAVEQLQVWGERNQVQVVAQQSGADSASVIFDAIQSAQARSVDVVIADTAGRLHNKSNLMQELAKVKRVMGKLDATAPHEVLLVLDAGTGQNALNQAQQFIDAAAVSGLVLTKLDGTAKGGVIFALTKKFNLPVRFVGVGEGIEDLQPFAAGAFVDALFAKSRAQVADADDSGIGAG
ncbi:signal recognition particle-docking protein FtsY [Exilibacterium tricleocarpae]|uniref:Signal recognition particle receptor FtsY n=1 Tax=Exilibacterium tricleocarpae TaxID=2591008 RepID=A0A545TZ84_9GAMM|nr:signal recognition particle-docking protein FtsY [Exilibacterium tricleocarpae]TQV82532.1 signal recognition particle-docking protein FtsY [Exilibacterium tricleocarpae]